MAIFDEQGTGGSGGLDPQKVRDVGLQGLKHAGTALRALFRVLPFMKVVSLGVILALLAALGAGLVQTVANGTYQVRQMVVTGAMEAKMEPGMWLKLFSDIKNGLGHRPSSSRKMTKVVQLPTTASRSALTTAPSATCREPCGSFCRTQSAKRST